MGSPPVINCDRTGRDCQRCLCRGRSKVRRLATVFGLTQAGRIVDVFAGELTAYSRLSS